jgi:lambda family phage minor tail protein L
MNNAFLEEKNKSVNTPINLVMLEVTKAYFALALVGSTSLSIVVSDTVDTALSDDNFIPDHYDIATPLYGYATFLTFESGKNHGAMRRVHSYSEVAGKHTFSFLEPLDFDPVGDKIRISRNLLLAQWDDNIDFYLPDRSSYTGIAQRYVPFPMKIELVGTNTTGELLTMSASISNVNRMVGNAIQVAKGLRGNRMIHIVTFKDILTDGKEGCLTNTMYIDSVTITPQDVVFVLESRMNVINVNLPFCNYNRDFCRWFYLTTECGWTIANGMDTTNYPISTELYCDHTLKGPNGCTAHKNVRRFGGFPALIGKN